MSELKLNNNIKECIGKNIDVNLSCVEEMQQER